MRRKRTMMARVSAIATAAAPSTGEIQIKAASVNSKVMPWRTITGIVFVYSRATCCTSSTNRNPSSPLRSSPRHNGVSSISRSRHSKRRLSVIRSRKRALIIFSLAEKSADNAASNAASVASNNTSSTPFIAGKPLGWRPCNTSSMMILTGIGAATASPEANSDAAKASATLR